MENTTIFFDTKYLGLTVSINTNALLYMQKYLLFMNWSKVCVCVYVCVFKMYFL